MRLFFAKFVLIHLIRQEIGKVNLMMNLWYSWSISCISNILTVITTSQTQETMIYIEFNQFTSIICYFKYFCHALSQVLVALVLVPYVATNLIIALDYTRVLIAVLNVALVCIILIHI